MKWVWTWLRSDWIYKTQKNFEKIKIQFGLMEPLVDVTATYDNER